MESMKHMNTERKIMKKKRGIGWVIASLALGIAISGAHGDVASAAEWSANSVAEIQQRLKETVGEGGIYTIQWGDTLSAISLASGVTVSDLADANNIKDIDLIYTGDILIIDKDAITELIKNNSYVDYKGNKGGRTGRPAGNVELSKVQQYGKDEVKPSEANKDIIKELERAVEKEANKKGKEAPKSIQPEKTKPEESKPEESKPEKTKPEESTDPKEEKPEENKPEVNKPEESTESEESKPEEEKPEESTEPDETKPEESTKPEENEPEETKPEEEKPEDGEVVIPGGDPNVSEEVVDENTDVNDTDAKPDKPSDISRDETVVEGETETSTEVIPGEVIPGEVIPGEIVEKEVPVLDEDGNPALDEDGNPVVEIIETQEPDTQLPDEKLPDKTKETTVQTNIKRIAPGTIYVEDTTLEVGQEIVDTEGVEGVQEIKTTTVTIDGEVVDTFSEVTTITEVVDRVIRYGTKPADVITTKTIIRTIETPFETIRRDNAELPVGEERVVQEGINSIKKEQYIQTFTNGELTSEEFQSIIDEIKGQNKIVEVGTKPKDVVTTKTVTRSVKTPFKTITKDNPNLPKGERRVVQEGMDGVREEVYLQTFVNGKLTNEEFKEVRSETPKKDQIIEVGTKEQSPKEDVFLNKKWSDSLPNVGDEIVRPGTMEFDKENYTVKQNPSTKHKVKDVEIAEDLKDKTWGDIKNDPNKDQKAASSTPSDYGSIITQDIGPNGEDLGSWRYGSAGIDSDTIKAFNENKLIDTELLNQLFIKKVNEERARIGKGAITYQQNKKVNEQAEKRTQYQAEENGYLRGYNIESGDYYGPHMLPNGGSWRDAYENPYYVDSDIFLVGENAAQMSWDGNPYQLVSEEYLADSFFNIWKNSPNHYRAMMNDNYESLVFSVKTGKYDAMTGTMFAPLIGTTTFTRPVQ